MDAVNFKELAETTVLSQYSASPHILGLVYAMADALDAGDDIQRFYDDVFNIDTCGRWGLKIWGIIVGAAEYVDVESTETFGYTGSLLHPFNQAPFFSKGSVITDKERLTVEAFRRLVLYKAMANIGEATAAGINRLFAFLYPDQVVVAVEDGPMRMKIIFSEEPTLAEMAILKTYGLLARGAGVGSGLFIAAESDTFGFAGSGFTGFDQGSFRRFDPQEEV